MAALAWLVAPAIAGRLTGHGTVPMASAPVLLTLAASSWQFVLVVILIRREQRTLRWPMIREALWLRSPRGPRNGHTGGRAWLMLLPFIAAFGAEQFIPTPSYPANHDFGAFLASHVGQSFLHGAWGWFGLIIVLYVFNTVLGEELLFRGFLLPRMNGAFGRGDWAANGVLFAAYHLHMPWAIPTSLVDTFTLAYPSKRYGSASMGIAVHSAQSAFMAVIVLTVVL